MRKGRSFSCHYIWSAARTLWRDTLDKERKKKDKEKKEKKWKTESSSLIGWTVYAWLIIYDSCRVLWLMERSSSYERSLISWFIYVQKLPHHCLFHSSGWQQCSQSLHPYCPRTFSANIHNEGKKLDPAYQTFGGNLHYVLPRRLLIEIYCFHFC